MRSGDARESESEQARRRRLLLLLARSVGAPRGPPLGAHDGMREWRSLAPADVERGRKACRQAGVSAWTRPLPTAAARPRGGKVIRQAATHLALNPPCRSASVRSSRFPATPSLVYSAPHGSGLRSGEAHRSESEPTTPTPQSECFCPPSTRTKLPVFPLCEVPFHVSLISQSLFICGYQACQAFHAKHLGTAH